MSAFGRSPSRVPLAKGERTEATADSSLNAGRIPACDRQALGMTMKQMEASARFGEADGEGHEGLGDEAAAVVAQVAFEDGQILSLTEDARFGKNDAAFDGFEKIHFHLDGGGARALRQGEIEGESAGGVGERRENAAVNDSVNLHVARLNFHPQNGAAGLGGFELESELARGVAEAESASESAERERLADFGRACHGRIVGRE
jgi:hypothetical protein